MIHALYGKDHEDLDVIADGEVGHHTGLALSRGRFPKGYAYVDANEDAAFAAEGPRGHLLVVADGHGGLEASHAAVTAIADQAGAQLESDEPPEDVVANLFRAARGEITRVLTGAPKDRRGSRTALSIAFVHAEGLHAATAGDTQVAVVGRRVAVEEPSHPFLAADIPIPKVRHYRLRTARSVVVVSDGVTDFLAHPWTRALRAELGQESDTPRGAAAQIVRAALDGGAGDNAAAAVWRR